MIALVQKAHDISASAGAGAGTLRFGRFRSGRDGLGLLQPAADVVGQYPRELADRVVGHGVEVCQDAGKQGARRRHIDRIFVGAKGDRRGTLALGQRP